MAAGGGGIGHVAGPGGTRPAAAPRGHGRAAGGGVPFRVSEHGGGGGAAAVATRAAGPVGAPALLALQEQGDGLSPPLAAAERDRRARRRGLALIGALRDLQLALLLGATGDTARLAELAALAEAKSEAAADPALREAIAAIALRARVELARHAGRRMPSHK
ncbi:flagellar assembly protein FliX [Caldovatus aquaticus]|nr:flagellar assembly protein FliX [Caldovatus aquaticus]